jgi:hypothetical protein
MADVERMCVEAAGEKLRGLLRKAPVGRGVYVRTRGKAILLGRKEPFGPKGGLIDDDRLKLARVGRDLYRLSARLANGRYQGTGFQGTIPEMVEAMCSFLAHYLQPWGTDGGTSPPRTSGRRH